MSDLKPCPFCGGKMDGYPDYTISFKRDRRKVHGIYYEVCTLHCNRCSCTIQQAGATREEAEKHAYNVWNERVTSAQPETHEECTETHACDLIDRQTAIDALTDDLSYYGSGDERAFGMSRAIGIIEKLPPAQPQRIKGRWIHDGYDIPHGVDWMHCSVCGRREPYVPAAMTNYCPTCGTEMETE